MVLVGGSEKYEFVNWNDDIPNDDGKVKECSKRQTRILQ